MNKYLAVMYLGVEIVNGEEQSKERGVLIEARNRTHAEQIVQRNKWTGKLVQIVRVVEPGSHLFEHITKLKDVA